MDMKTHEFAAIAIVMLLVVWVGFAAISPSYAARTGLLSNSLGGAIGAVGGAAANLAGNNGASTGTGASAGNTGTIEMEPDTEPRIVRLAGPCGAIVYPLASGWWASPWACTCSVFL